MGKKPPKHVIELIAKAQGNKKRAIPSATLMNRIKMRKPKSPPQQEGK